MKTKWFIVGFALLALMLLLSCSPSSDGTPKTVEVEIETVIETVVVEKELETIVETVEVTIEAEVEEEVPLAPKEQDAVVLIIIDDFDPPPAFTATKFISDTLNSIEKIAALNNEDEDGGTVSCVVTPDGQQYGARGAIVGSSTQPHGDLVYQVAQELFIQSYGSPPTQTTENGSFPDNSPEWLHVLEEWRVNGESLLLAGMDTDNYNSDEIKNYVEDAIDDFFSPGFNWGNTTFTAHRFVLNMSFALIPCDPEQVPLSIDDYYAILEGPEWNWLNGNQDFLALKEALDDTGKTDDEKSQVLWQIIPLLAAAYPPTIYPSTDSSTDTWPYYNWLRNDYLNKSLSAYQDKTDIQLISVGAAGNYGEKGYVYPFAPAIWDRVISVSASQQTNNPIPMDYSNPGEILMCGELDDNDCTDSTQTEFPSFVVGLPFVEDNEAGTSFAAPRLSYEAAIYLLNGGVIDCNNSYPWLGYAQGDGPWNNYILGGAEAAGICP